MKLSPLDSIQGPSEPKGRGLGSSPRTPCRFSRPACSGQDLIVGIVKSAPILTPPGQRDVTVLILV